MEYFTRVSSVIYPSYDEGNSLDRKGRIAVSAGETVRAFRRGDKTTVARNRKAALKENGAGRGWKREDLYDRGRH